MKGAKICGSGQIAVRNLNNKRACVHRGSIPFVIDVLKSEIKTINENYPKASGGQKAAMKERLRIIRSYQKYLERKIKN